MRGCTPIPTTTKSHSRCRPSLVRTRSTAPSPSNASTLVPMQHPHAVIGVDVAVDAAHLAAQHALQRDRVGGDEGDLESALPRRRGDLGADPAGADHDHRAAAVEPFAQRVGVLDAAQVVHAVELGAGNREPARLGAGGQQQPVVAQPLAVVERHLLQRRVHVDRRAAQAQLDVVVGVEALAVDVDAVAVGLAAQVVLRQRRALVRALVLGADEHQAPLEALVSQGLSGLGAGQAGADDHECLLSGHGKSSRSGPGTPGGSGGRRGSRRAAPR